MEERGGISTILPQGCRKPLRNSAILVSKTGLYPQKRRVWPCCLLTEENRKSRVVIFDNSANGKAPALIYDSGLACWLFRQGRESAAVISGDLFTGNL